MMKARTWRLALVLVLALGIVSALGVSATDAFAASEPQIKNAPAPANWGGCWYVVRRGDTLFSIGMRYGVSPWYLAQINGLYNPNLIFACMTLTVPCDQHPPKPPRPPKEPPCGETTYLVKPGDNLFRIALNHGSTVNAIRDANHLWGKVLRPGRTLVIPIYKPVAVTEEGGAGKGELPPNGNCVPNGAPPPEKEAPAPEMTPSTQGQPPPPAEGQATPPAEGQATPPADGQVQGLPPEPSGSIILTATAVDPASATITAGQSILWINNSENVYTIVSGLPGQPNEMFTSGELPPGATWIHTFDAAGSYSYFVNENPTLIGQVTVNP
jgi:LysM repeat protein